MAREGAPLGFFGEVADHAEAGFFAMAKNVGIVRGIGGRQLIRVESCGPVALPFGVQALLERAPRFAGIRLGLLRVAGALAGSRGLR